MALKAITDCVALLLDGRSDQNAESEAGISRQGFPIWPCANQLHSDEAKTAKVITVGSGERYLLLSYFVDDGEDGKRRQIQS